MKSLQPASLLNSVVRPQKSKEHPMHVRTLLGAIAVAVVAAVADPTVMMADDAGAPRKLMSQGGVAVGADALGGALATEANGNAAACFGFVKVGGKLRYT